MISTFLRNARLQFQIMSKGTIHFGIFDHQLIFCTRKAIKTKTGSHKHISFCSLKSYYDLVY